MVITRELLYQKFNRFNKEYFDNRLNKVVFKFFNGKRNYGRCLFGSRDGKIPTEIWISQSMSNCENTLDETLIHEMIHQYEYEVLHCMKYRIITHGLRFRYVCWRLNRKYGLKIKPTSWF